MKKNVLLKHIIRILPLLILLFLFSCRQNSQITVNELQDHIKYLASDSLKGRLTGSTGDSLAAEYIRSKLLSYGLSPLNGDGLQRFKVTKKVAAGKSNSLSINGTAYILIKILCLSPLVQTQDWNQRLSLPDTDSISTATV